MDFTVDQSEGTTFMYVMPTSPTTALVEYTLFTPNILEEKKYDKAITDYIHKTYGSIDYEVTHQEFGKIPMTNYSFAGGNGNLINIGVAVKGDKHFIAFARAVGATREGIQHQISGPIYPRAAGIKPLLAKLS